MSQKIREIYKGAVPVILKSRTQILRKTKFLTPKEMTMSEFEFHVKPHLGLQPTESYTLFTERNTIPSKSMMIQEIDEKYKNKDGYLYFNLEKENYFG